MTYEELEEIRKEINICIDDDNFINFTDKKEFLHYENKVFTIEIEKERKFISISSKEDYGFNVNLESYRFLKACLEFTETQVEERELKKTYRFEVFEEVDIKAETQEEAEKKLKEDFPDFFYNYMGVVDENGEVIDD